MDSETVQAAKSLLADGNRRVRADLRRDRARALATPNGSKVGNTGVHAMSVGRAAFFRALATEGAEILKPAGEGYWHDMARRHEHLRSPVYTGAVASLDGTRTRFGKVTMRFRDGKWWKPGRDGTWTEVKAPRRKW